MQAPQIKTERLLIKELDMQDAAAMYAYRSDSHVTRYQTWRPASEKEVREFICKMNHTGFNRMDTWFQLGMYLRENGQLIGDLGLHFLSPDNDQIEIGFTVNPAYQHRGYAAEAVRSLMHYFFKSLHTHRIIASVDPKNIASIALLEKIGMRKEAHFRQSIRSGNTWEDDVIYALLQEEWTKE